MPINWTLFESAPDPVSLLDRFRADVLRGLSLPAKELPCKYFYDAEGSRLFDQITELPEYYLTRTELGIMEQSAAEMAAALGPACLLIEYGSGSGVKTHRLLQYMKDPAGYMPIELSAEPLRQSVLDLSLRFPELAIAPVLADFTKPFPVPSWREHVRHRAVYFPGSTIGNFTPTETVALLKQTARLVGGGGGLLLGADLKKEPALLHAAYNDAQGITAAFNLNLLTRVNRELEGDFPLDQFWHHALYHPGAGRMEMYLVSRREVEVHVGAVTLGWQEGEPIRTEYSYKYTLASLRNLAEEAGFRADRVWTDRNCMFAVVHFRV